VQYEAALKGLPDELQIRALNDRLMLTERAFLGDPVVHFFFSASPTLLQLCHPLNLVPASS
jgi:hypothetical protein